MEIIRKFNEKIEKFGDVDCSTVFMYDNVCYIKTSGETTINSGLTINAVSLEDGVMCGFRDCQEVRIVKATLTIED
jgi:hypothetical protein